jgi:hypothetical protein
MIEKKIIMNEETYRKLPSKIAKALFNHFKKYKYEFIWGDSKESLDFNSEDGWFAFLGLYSAIIMEVFKKEEEK